MVKYSFSVFEPSQRGAQTHLNRIGFWLASCVDINLDAENNCYTRYSDKSAYRQLFSRRKKIHMKRDTNKESGLSTQLVALPMRNILSTFSGKHAVRRLFGLTLLTLLTACKDGGQSGVDEIDFARWTNPVTGTVVELPEGWRKGRQVSAGSTACIHAPSCRMHAACPPPRRHACGARAASRMTTGRVRAAPARTARG